MNRQYLPRLAGRVSRRAFVAGAGLAALGARCLQAGETARDPAAPRRLSFVHTHTRERLSVTYFRSGTYLPDALSRLDVLLRDFRTETVHPIEPGLLDLLYTLQLRAGRTEAFDIISAYRSPVTNARLRRRSGGVAEHSLHMEGRAIDVRLPGFATGRLALLARELQIGGVGYYRVSDFVHVDTGHVRLWGDPAG